MTAPPRSHPLAPDPSSFLCFFFNETATTEIYPLSLHDALPISLYRDHFGPVQGGGTVIWFTRDTGDRKSTRLNSSHGSISYAVFCLDTKSTRLYSSNGSTSAAVFSLARTTSGLTHT